MVVFRTLVAITVLSSLTGVADGDGVAATGGEATERAAAVGDVATEEASTGSSAAESELLAKHDSALGAGKGNLELGIYLGGWMSNYFHDFYAETPSLGVTELSRFNLQVGLRAGYFFHDMIGAEAEFQYVMTSTMEFGHAAPIYGLRAHAVGQYPKLGRVTPFAVFGVGLARLSSPASVIGSDTDIIFHTGVGAKLHVNSSIGVRFDARFLRGPASRESDSGANYAEVMVGVIFVPRMPKNVEPPEPDPISDPLQDPDKDKDGIRDEDDLCPEEAEDKDGYEDNDGCPDLDNDSDGIPDDQDKCPDEPEDMDGYQDRDGCDDPDNDNDGIPDVIDHCTLEPETINGNNDEDGCPDEGTSLVIIMPAHIEIYEPIQFRGNTDVILKKSHNVLGQIAAHMRVERDILRIRIAVHVHPRTNDDVDLTKRRAMAVRKWLVSRGGIAKERLEVKGYGSARLLAPVNSRGAKKLNDRVEFIILEKRIKKTK